jgi:hypothetical protein
MACFRHSIFRSQLVVIAMALGLWLISNGLASASAPPALQAIINQVATYAKTDQIYDPAAADDLTSILTSVNSAIADGDPIMARSLLDGFTSDVNQMSDHLMTISAADKLKSMAMSLSMSF